jgi:hypothetical protein
MPFRYENTSAFGLGDLETLAAAFNSAWQQLLSVGIQLETDEEIREFKNLLAQCILCAAIPGQLNETKLTNDGLQALFDSLRQAGGDPQLCC